MKEEYGVNEIQVLEGLESLKTTGSYNWTAKFEKGPSLRSGLNWS